MPARSAPGVADEAACNLRPFAQEEAQPRLFSELSAALETRAKSGSEWEQPEDVAFVKVLRHVFRHLAFANVQRVEIALAHFSGDFIGNVQKLPHD